MPKTSDRTRRLGNLEQKLAAYAMAGGAVVAATAGEAKAGLITVDVNQTIGTGIGQSTTYDLTIGGSTILEFTAVTDQPLALIQVTTSSAQGVVFDAMTQYASNLAVGNTVSASNSFGGSMFIKYLSMYGTSGVNYGDFLNVSSGYLGFSFADPTVANPNQIDYGYITLSNSFGDSSPSATVTIDSFTYDNSGAAVTVGASAVPERASLTMRAMGATGVGAYLAHRRKKTT